jgi:CDP-diacylglycerol--serine O-phosphatidyltransferase
MNQRTSPMQLGASATHVNGRRRLNKPRRPIPPASVLPTMCTLGNLVAGFAAIVFAARPDIYEGPWGWSGLTMAGAMVFFGIFLDAIDGSVARLTRSTSEIGGQLDSFADAVTFGVAPAFMTLRLADHYLRDGNMIAIGPEADLLAGRIIWGAAAVYICCAALRLARFNVEVGAGEVNDHRIFRGFPSPGAAGTLASLVVLHQHLFNVRYGGDVSQTFARTAALGLPLVMLLCGLAMVSSIPYVHFTNRYVRGRRNFAWLVRVIVPLFLLIWLFQYAIAALFTIYALSGPVRLLIYRLRLQRRRTMGP